MESGLLQSTWPYWRLDQGPFSPTKVFRVRLYFTERVRLNDRPTAWCILYQAIWVISASDKPSSDHASGSFYCAHEGEVMSVPADLTPYLGSGYTEAKNLLVFLFIQLVPAKFHKPNEQLSAVLSFAFLYFPLLTNILDKQWPRDSQWSLRSADGVSQHHGKQHVILTWPRRQISPELQTG